ncbi:MAG: outer membrane lipid asymmetry maintenance protein MlaD [Betaproteobacteria bacterium]|nr:outer membrane lipid asymmetry maintenance protein MlaD [Betaproteobacteria bacterium]NBT75063.1 outer membrane lipid asymmetry maintenance protein MlaD [Betaproteobacteria bacterium]NBY13345.1 outer membrane lipid asymmetry maintenance protein MlaD [Betaproteobacteria bacterium]NCA16269.1 outer membrane lipid asymmetry maintenance protein MlaD [Betaproteobacteria bacterium]NDF03749.1 outer membrane lipid asymmetry maintenance protein MlaD [Betaproteobacteria bacterium]
MQRHVNLLVGFFVLLGLGALIFLSLRVSNLTESSTGPTYAVKAYFDDIGGLKPRAAVRSAGVLVGRVREIGFDDQRYQAVVTIDLVSSVRFPKDSSAQILTAGLLGEKYVGLLPGAEADSLANNDRISMTQSAVVLENIISQFLYNKSGDAGSGDKGLK